MLDLAELSWQDVHVAGSLVIHAEQAVGHVEEGDGEKRVVFSEQVGRVSMEGVRVEN